MRPKGGEKGNMAISWEIKEGFQKNNESLNKLGFFLEAFRRKRTMSWRKR